MDFVFNESQIRDNALRFDGYRNSENPTEREFFGSILKNGRHFVCFKNGTNNIFCPSRFCGYQNNNMRAHRANDTKDGRDTTPEITNYLGTLASNPRVDKLYRDLCARVGVSPSRHPRKYWRMRPLVDLDPAPASEELVSETNLIPKLEPSPSDTEMSLDNSASQSNDSTPSNRDEQDSFFAEAESEIALEGGFDPTNDEDARHRVYRGMVQRRGQPQFRASVLAAYRNRCAVTKCSVVKVLEAAHIAPYNGEQTNDPRNGLLLRADIHLLFDLDLIGINPKTMKIVLSDKAKTPTYAKYDGNDLRQPIEPFEHCRPYVKCLELRWQQFCNANGFASAPAS